MSGFRVKVMDRMESSGVETVRCPAGPGRVGAAGVAGSATGGVPGGWVAATSRPPCAPVATSEVVDTRSPGEARVPLDVRHDASASNRVHATTAAGGFLLVCMSYLPSRTTGPGRNRLRVPVRPYSFRRSIETPRRIAVRAGQEKHVGRGGGAPRASAPCFEKAVALRVGGAPPFNRVGERLDQEDLGGEAAERTRWSFDGKRPLANSRRCRNRDARPTPRRPGREEGRGGRAEGEHRRAEGARERADERGAVAAGAVGPATGAAFGLRTRTSVAACVLGARCAAGGLVLVGAAGGQGRDVLRACAAVALSAKALRRNSGGHHERKDRGRHQQGLPGGMRHIGRSLLQNPASTRRRCRRGNRMLAPSRVPEGSWSRRRRLRWVTEDRASPRR